MVLITRSKSKKTSYACFYMSVVIVMFFLNLLDLSSGKTHSTILT